MGAGFDSRRGLAVFDGLANQQAAMTAYLDDFKLMLWITLLAIPMLLLMRPPRRRAVVESGPADTHAAFE
jgi:DHA2 family multidrug resistance protein